MSDEIRIGVIGAGAIAASHLAACRDNEGLRAVAIADINLESAQRRADEFGVPHVFQRYEDLIARDDVDAVINCLPNYLHAPVSIAALEAGKHVLCEKPMARTAEEAEKMLETAKRHDRVLMIGLNHRYRPEVLALRRWVEEGKLGKIYLGESGWIRRKGIPGWGSWFTQKEYSGGGALIDIGVHMLDLVWFLMGTPKPKAVSAVTFQELGTRKIGLGDWGTPNFDGTFDVDDLASAMIRFEDGTALNVQVSWAAHRPDATWTRLLGNAAGAEVTEGGVTIYREEDGRTVTEHPPIPHQGAGDVRAPHFAECIRTGSKPLSSGEDGLVLQRMLDAIYRSSELQQEVAP